MKYDIIVIGGATEDITFYTREGVLINNKKDLFRQKLLAFEYGAKIKIDKSFSNFGGGAANAAVCFSTLGFNVAGIAAIGEDDRGERIIANFKKRGVDTSLVQRVKKTETGYSFLLVGQDNEHIVFSNRAANDGLKITGHELDYLKKTKWIYLTSLSGEWLPNLNMIFSVDDVKVAWNPGHRQIMTGLKTIGKYLSKLTVLNVNQDEAIEIAASDKNNKNKTFGYYQNVKNLLISLKNWGPKIVVITRGKQGADAYDGIKFYHQAVVKEKIKADTTGVGDAFGSSFIAGLELFNGDIKKALYAGALNTASVISRPGAQNGLLNREEVLKKIDKAF